MTPQPWSDEYRWAQYARTLVEVEITPGHWIHLNGPEAIDEWPWSLPVHIVTAWNPGADFRSDDENREQQRALIRELEETGLTWLPAHGSGFDVDHGEESVAVFDLGRDAAVALARRWSQDAVFELEADTMWLVFCIDDRVVELPRRHD